MKNDRHVDIDAMLHQLPQDANKALKGLEATTFLKARIDRAAAQQKQGKTRFVLPNWAPALCCAAIVLVLGLSFWPTNQPDPLINSNMLGPTEEPAGLLTADLHGSDLFITTGNANPGYRNIWSAANNGAFPLIGINGKYYRMLTNPHEVDGDLLTQSAMCISEFTTEPSLSGTDGILSNAASSGAFIYQVKGISTDTLIAAEVDGRMRLFQRVSFNGNALRGKEKLADTLNLSGKVIAMELTGAGTVTDPAACEELLELLLTDSGYESSGSISSKKALLIELDNGLVLQLAVKGENLAGCGVWSCPEFFEAFDHYCN